MSMTTLKYWRLIIPGIFVASILILSMQENFSELFRSLRSVSDFQLDDLANIVVVVVFGVLYYILNIRNLLWNPYYNRVQDNIKNTLIRPFAQQLDSQQENYLKEGRRLMHIFYHFIDYDKSLSEKAKGVRFNGLIWTSTVDLTIISAIGSLIFWVELAIETNSYNLWMAIILLVMSLVSFGLIQLTTRRHISLSNEQLEFICQSYTKELQEKIDELLQTQ